MGEARNIRNAGKERIACEGAVSPYAVLQAPSGKAGVYNNPVAASTGQYIDLETVGTFTITKATGWVGLKGGRVYWDRSAGNALYKPVNDRDFYIGRLAEDCTSGSATCVVLLNEDPPYDIDLASDGFISVLVGTPAAGGFGYPVNLGGSLVFELTATSEAQKVDALSVKGFAVAANAIIEGCFRVISDGGSGSQDISIGVASGTHASDFESVAELATIHLDGNATAINAESDDGTTDVAPTDTTADYVEGSALANRVYFSIDLRDPASVKFYVDGSAVLTGTTFDLSAAVGPLFLVVHVEKSTGTDTYKLALDHLRARFAEQ